MSGLDAQLLSDLFINRDLLAVLAHALELHSAVNLGEQSVVAALANVVAGMDVSAALTNQHVAGQNELTIGALDAQSLGLGVTAGEFDGVSDCYPAGQAVLLGISVGRRLVGFAELGSGTMYMGGMIGVGYRF